MSTTSNPVVRHILVSARAPEPVAEGERTTSKRRRVPLRQATGTERLLVIDDIVIKTGIALAIVVASAFLTVFLGLQVLLVPALLVGLGLTLYSVFRPRPLASLTIVYSVAEGVVLGAITEVFESVHDGIATQAVIGTCGAFLGMLVVYKTRVLRLTPKAVQWIIVSILGAIILMAVDLTAFTVFNTDLGMRGDGPWSIAFSAIFIAVAAISLLLNFKAADEMIRLGVPQKWSWYLAFGLIGTLVWLYLELLWLLGSIR